MYENTERDIQKQMNICERSYPKNISQNVHFVVVFVLNCIRNHKIKASLSDVVETPL